MIYMSVSRPNTSNIKFLCCAGHGQQQSHSQYTQSHCTLDSVRDLHLLVRALGALSWGGSIEVIASVRVALAS